VSETRTQNAPAVAATRPLNAHEAKIELAKLQAATERLGLLTNCAKTIIVSATIAGSLWIIFKGLEPILEGKNAESIGAIAKLVDALHLGSVLGYAWGAVATLGYAFERSRKKSP